MRVLLVVGVVGGGVGRHVRQLAVELVGAGQAVVVACPQSVADRFDLVATGARVQAVEVGVGSPGDLARSHARLRRLARGAQVVHAHGVRAGAAAALSVGRGRSRRVPLVVTSHNGPPDGPAASWTYAALEALVCSRADLVLGVSSDLVERARRRGARATGLAVVPSSAAAPATDAQRELAARELRAELGVPDGAGVVLAAGRLARQKRVDLLLDAYRRLREDPRLGSSPVLVVVGEGPLAAALREQAASGGGDVHFLGHRQDVPRLLAGADVVVSSADWEGQPLVLQEALAAGAPVVATDVGGTADLLGGAGVLVRPGSSAELAGAVAGLLLDPGARADLARRARDRAGRLPTRLDALEAVLTAYRGVLPGPDTPVDPTLRAAALRAPRVDLESRTALLLARSVTALVPGRRVASVSRRVVRHHGVRLRVYTPSRPSGAGLLWIHGGGLVLGSAAMDDRHCGQTARDTGVTVVSVDYRLAPRHPFPAALDDCLTGWRWLRAHAAELGLDHGRLAIGGQSAGGGLAASLVQRVVDGGDPVAAQWLFCPMLDDRTAVDRDRDAVGHLVWDNRSNRVGWSAYLGAAVGAPSLPPYAAPARREDLSGLPPTWISTSDIELFFDEDTDYARRLRAAGTDVTLEVVAGAPHGFEAWAPRHPLALELLATARSWLADRLAPGPA
ncbi:alpha/beta hydrolase fold domain-containing protein [uncultured Serinicoccus sp.]|uniref:alpha/beta hydrolase fold domain-containing protein n=1 Tax=uncultured Serinicoccus sp. TaxID=735514 RepID=UPI00261F5126|nr:alpha/beta hydrolase fold domain-containing protein [uncultured Serinicoccus sp.]